MSTGRLRYDKLAKTFLAGVTRLRHHPPQLNTGARRCALIRLVCAAKSSRLSPNIDERAFA